MKVTGKQRNSRMCFICGMDNPVGFHSQFYNMEDGSVMTPIRFGENHQSFPGRVHGGLIATMLDELGLRALWSGGDESQFGVTMSIETKYRKPVPYEEDLFGKGMVVRETKRFFEINTAIVDGEGKTLANAVVKYLKLDPQSIKQGINLHEEMCYLIEDDVTELGY